ncbi:efflux RND transporter periplasmic adaptor subunit [Paracoccus sp. MBLB3053]|uniref:Efflux RND transporter periplasmic adaptor subunit n=1 Tax=Paracoccus aurantius TaxID=3073814 RepID=A0ABU2HQU8_9RHOB|nr:efflux RND transporter periplasmic adaptor subunit [Paracoccus sp. MBLB3053]MDS9466935.1 efflux RND transporter periplasmic adaptor subunit [Paracoccus sp. MBLB3053]
MRFLAQGITKSGGRCALTGSLVAMVLASPGAAEEPLRVELFTVQEVPLIFDAALSGTIHPTDSIDIGFRQGGRVIEVQVNEGDAVKRNEPLARTDPLQQEQSLHVAEAALASAVASQEQSRQAQERARAMLERGVGTRAELDLANQALSSADRSLAQAHSSRDQAQRALDDTVIRAPADAIVTARNAEPGQIVGAAQPVITLASSSGREVVFQTPNSPMLDAALGAKVRLSGIDFPDMRLEAQVTEIAPLVSPGTGSVTVRAKIVDPPPGYELLGAAFRGAVHFPVGKGISVPWTALTSLGSRPAVWVVDGQSRVELAEVTIQRFAEGEVIIGTGLTPGQLVVGAGSQLLFPGRKVIADRIEEQE